MGRNLFNIHQETKLDPLSSSKVHVGDLLFKSTIPVEDSWKLPFLERLLREREVEDPEVEEIIDIVCTSSFC